MAILLIRHGETPGNAARVVQRPEVPLSEIGRDQAERLARRLRDFPVGGILASDLARAALTAEAIARHTGAAIAHEPLLQERNFGDVRGRAYAELGFDLFAPDFEPPGGESWGAFHQRVVRAWERILAVAADTPGDLAVVTHGLVCRALVTRHCALAPGAAAPLGFGNTSLTQVEPAPPHAVRLLDCTAHLAGDAPRAGGVA